MQSSNMQKGMWREESVSCWGRVERETEDVQFARARTEKPKVIQYRVLPCHSVYACCVPVM